MVEGELLMLPPGIANPFGLQRSHIDRMFFALGLNVATMLPVSVRAPRSVCV